MGLLSDIVGTERKNDIREKEETNAPGENEMETKTTNKRNTFPISMTLSFTPFRLKEHKEGFINLVAKLRNHGDEDYLVSLDLLLPRNELLGFDSTCVNKYMEKKIGILPVGKEITASIPVWSSNQTRRGNYPLDVTLYIHYLTYDKVLSYMKKRIYVKIV